MELNKFKIGDNDYVRISLEKKEYINSLNCVESKLLYPKLAKRGPDIGDKLYVVLEVGIAKKLAKKMEKA